MSGFNQRRAVPCIVSDRYNDRFAAPQKRAATARTNEALTIFTAFAMAKKRPRSETATHKQF